MSIFERRDNLAKGKEKIVQGIQYLYIHYLEKGLLHEEAIREITKDIGVILQKADF